MKTLSLWEPYASFIAQGLKKFETRHWHAPQSLIGQQIAIHAAKRPMTADELQYFLRLRNADVARIVNGKLPYGCVVCVCTLDGCYRTEGIRGSLSPLERSLGNYDPGRFAWELVVEETFEPAIPAKGAQGIWEWRR